MTPPIRIDYAIRPDTRVTRGSYIVSLSSNAGDLHLLFEGDDEKMAEKLDELTANLLEMRGRIIRRLAENAPVEA